MARIIVLLAIVILGYLFWQGLKQRNPEQRRKLLLQGTLCALIIVTLLLAATGRVHWIMAAVAAALPFIKGLLGLLLRGFPFLQAWLKHRSARTEQTSSPSNPSEPSEEEAWQLLGLQPGASRDDIVRAHKRLIQKLHPDRGGNDYLAAKLNAARDLLLNMYDR